MAHLPTAVVAGGIVVPDGGRLIGGGGSIGFACTDFKVGSPSGSFGAAWVVLSSDTLGAIANYRQSASGRTLGGSSDWDVSGDWDNAGDFSAQNSTARFTDTCGLPSSTFAGSTIFADLSLVSANGHKFILPSGLTQSVTGRLSITGVNAPITLVASGTASRASLKLAVSGSQSISRVAVNRVQATGQWLAPNQRNQLIEGDAPGWFAARSLSATAVPVLGVGSLLALLACIPLTLLRLRRSMNHNIFQQRSNDEV